MLVPNQSTQDRKKRKEAQLRFETSSFSGEPVNDIGAMRLMDFGLKQGGIVAMSIRRDGRLGIMHMCMGGTWRLECGKSADAKTIAQPPEAGALWRSH